MPNPDWDFDFEQFLKEEMTRERFQKLYLGNWPTEPFNINPPKPPRETAQHIEPIFVCPGGR